MTVSSLRWEIQLDHSISSVSYGAWNTALNKRNQKGRSFSSVLPHTQISSTKRVYLKTKCKEVSKKQMTTWKKVFIFQSSQQLMRYHPMLKNGVGGRAKEVQRP